jgi:hypothetical protein
MQPRHFGNPRRDRHTRTQRSREAADNDRPDPPSSEKNSTAQEQNRSVSHWPKVLNPLVVAMAKPVQACVAERGSAGGGGYYEPESICVRRGNHGRSSDCYRPHKRQCIADRQTKDDEPAELRVLSREVEYALGDFRDIYGLLSLAIGT